MTLKTINETLEKVQSNVNGLTFKEANKRLQKNGLNILEKDKKPNPIIIFFKQLIDPLVYVLLAAFVLSLFLKELTDAIIIIVVVFLNATLSTIQELKAKKALKSLAKLTRPTCLVKRDQQIIEIKSSDLVVGDIVILEAGRNVPADLRLIKSNHLLIDESSLTGESLPVSKDATITYQKELPLGDQKNMAFMATYIVKGSGEGVVTNIGMKTQIGQIATFLKHEKKKVTPLQKKLNEISKVLAISTIFLCALIFIIAILQKRNSLEMLITAISLAVAVIPEGLLAVVTIVLSLGVLKLSKVKAIVKKLPSVETLGCVNVICSDKTGTLTLNQMSVTKIMLNNKILTIDKLTKNKEVELLALASICCNDATFNNNTYLGDPTEIALLKFASIYNITPLLRKDCLPFDSERKMMSTLNDNYLFSKGALDSILPKCQYYQLNNEIKPLNQITIQNIIKQHDTLAKEGLRILAFAYKKTTILQENNLIFLGLVALIDPPREEVYESIANLKKAHIKTIMITGDHKETALAIASKLNITSDENKVITGQELDKIPSEKLALEINSYQVFARVSPIHKMMIVKALQENNNVVAMTGDGINDAPSLKKADIGIAMGQNGTDVAKDASDMILMDDNFTTIEHAVKEGRGIFNNIKKTLLFLLSSNMGEVLVMFLAILFNLPVPLIAIHILWVNLLTDTLPSLALGQDDVDDDVMKELPRNSNESIFAHGGYKIILGYGLIIGLLSLASYLYVPIFYLLTNDIDLSFTNIINLLENDQDILLKAQTLAFSTLALSQLFHSLGMKNLNKSIFNKKTLKNHLLIFSLVFGIIMQLLVTMVPPLCHLFKTSILDIKDFLIVLLFSSGPLIIHEIKVLFKNC